jgi:pSer/pThr/pTyr-binding forkhead associated (FHA) protein
MIVCPNCNHSNPDDTLQCEACYQTLPFATTCPKCGTNILSTTLFCDACGHDLESEVTILQSKMSAESTMLVAKQQPDLLVDTSQQSSFPVLLHLQTQQEIDLKTEIDSIYIGKPNDRIAPDINVALFPDSDIVSRVHAAIHIKEDKYYVEDLGSANGTYLNQTLLAAKTAYPLKSGDRISLGKGDKVTFIFQIFLE